MREKKEREWEVSSGNRNLILAAEDKKKGGGKERDRLHLLFYFLS